MHNFPDPDSITSALLLQAIVKKFNLRSKIVYQGNVTREENLSMIKLLKLKINFFKEKEIDKYDLIAAVDFQRENSNHSIPNPHYPSITFDHHPLIRSVFKKKNFYEINHRMGSTATILLEYFFHFNLTLNKTLATAYVYTILTETNHFNRDHTNKDILYYKKCLNLADIKVLFKIENTPKKEAFYKILKSALNKYQVFKEILFCQLGEVSNLELIQEVAEFFIKKEAISFTIVTGTFKGTGKVCSRTNVKKIHLGNLLKASLKNLGAGGGHAMMAAGNFKAKEEVVMNRVMNNIKSKLKL